MTRVLPLGVLLAASTLSAQYVTLSGAGGAALETYSTAINTGLSGGFTELRLSFDFDYLVVGGGGAGGTGGGNGGENTWGAGGGGAGGVLSGQLELPVWPVGDATGSINVVVGAGGAAAAYNAGSTSNGASGNSSWFATPDETHVALGGGGGAGSNNSSTGGVGLNGASGGGGGGDGLRAGGTGTTGQGYAGGTSRTSAGNRAAGGGGGGAGGAGQIGGPPLGHSSGVGGNGGVGLASDITGSSVYYGGGGGGGGRDTNPSSTSAGGSGGNGGGGAGSGQGAATSGTDGLGGGGGGSGADGKGGDGGDGVVVIRYKGAAAGTGGTVTSGTGSASGYTLHTFGAIGGGGQLQVLDLSSTNLNTRLGSTVSSTVSGGGSLSINTPGTIVYTGAASHTGGTDIQAGTLQVGNGGTTGYLGESAIMIYSGATLAHNVYNYVQNRTILVNEISGAGTFVKQGSQDLILWGDFSAMNGSFQIDEGTLGLSVAWGLTRTSVATTSGSGSLMKYDGGDLILTGTLGHTGGTTVGAGKLVINGTHVGDVTVMSNVFDAAILGGSGTIQGNTVVHGIHAPGNSPGVQQFSGNLTYEEGSTIAWELAANTTSNTPLAFDQIVVSGQLTFAGATSLDLIFDWTGSTVDWTNALWDANQSWNIISVQGCDIVGLGNLGILTENWLDSNGLAFDTVLAGGTFTLSQSGEWIVLNYAVAPIPEPSTYGLMLGALALAGAAVRRRRAKRG